MSWAATVLRSYPNPVPDGATWYDILFVNGSMSFQKTFHVVPANIPNPAQYLANYVAGLNAMETLATSLAGLIGNTNNVAGGGGWQYRITSVDNATPIDGSKAVTVSIFDAGAVHLFTNKFILSPLAGLTLSYLSAWLASYVAQITNVDYEAFYLATVSGSTVQVG